MAKLIVPALNFFVSIADSRYLFNRSCLSFNVSGEQLGSRHGRRHVSGNFSVCLAYFLAVSISWYTPGMSLLSIFLRISITVFVNVWKALQI